MFSLIFFSLDIREHAKHETVVRHIYYESVKLTLSHIVVTIVDSSVGQVT